MTKPHLILIHGMGTHDEETFKKTVIEPLNKASEYFESIDKFEDMVKLHYIDYNSIFEDVRRKISETEIDNLDTKFPNAPSLIANINKFHGKFNNDSFFYTHWLDVLIYSSFYKDAVQVRVAKQLLEAMREAIDEAADVHILCHSLGTAVMHDTLHKLYINDIDPSVGKNLLSAGLNRIKSITMVANVSQLLEVGANPYTSVVKPGLSGICDFFLNCRHVLDPIPSIEKFDPGAHWLDFNTSEFKNVSIRGVERANVHDLDHYLTNPRIFIPLFYYLFQGIIFTKQAEVDKAYAEHERTTVQGRFEKLREELGNASITLQWNPDTMEFDYTGNLKDIEKQLVDFIDHLEAIKESFSVINN